MTLAVLYSASITCSQRATLADGCTAAADDVTRTLMEAALVRIEGARGPDGEVDLPSVESAVSIFLGLRDALDLRRGGDIAVNVAELYDYICRRLGSAGLRNGMAALDEVSHLLQALRSAWAFLPEEVRATSRK